MESGAVPVKDLPPTVWKMYIPYREYSISSCVNQNPITRFSSMLPLRKTFSFQTWNMNLQWYSLSLFSLFLEAVLLMSLILMILCRSWSLTALYDWVLYCQRLLRMHCCYKCVCSAYTDAKQVENMLQKELYHCKFIFLLHNGHVMCGFECCDWPLNIISVWLIFSFLKPVMVRFWKCFISNFCNRLLFLRHLLLVQ